MTASKLVRGVMAGAMLTSATACSQAETNEQAQQAAAEVREVAAKAGDRMADSWITTKIQAQYFADEQIKARYIDVSTRDGIATVKGYVDSTDARERAIRIARSTAGVSAVQDQLLIGRTPQELERAGGVVGAVATAGERAATAAVDKLDDARVTSSVQARFFLDTLVKGRRIDVDARNGHVTLRGVVASEAERAQALLLARTTEGVQRVDDQLTVDAGL